MPVRSRVCSSGTGIARRLMYAAAFLVLVCGGANAADLYVAKNGNDANSGSMRAPLLTVQRAADLVHAGDTVYIRNGTYVENVTIRASGAAGSYITFKPYPGDAVIIDGTGNEGWHGVISIHGERYIQFDGLEIRNNSVGWGVLVEHAEGNNAVASSNIMLKNLLVHDTGGESIQIRGNAHDVVIDNCTVHDAANPSGIDIYQWDGGRPQRITVTACTAYNFPGFAGIASEQADNLVIVGNRSYGNELGIDVGSGKNNIIRDNIIWNSSTGIALSSNTDSKIYNNVIHDIYDEAIYSYYWANHGEPHARNKWYNNYVYNAGFGIFESKAKPGYASGISTDQTYYNNLFYNIGTHGSYRVPFYFDGVTNVMFYNNTIYMNTGYDALQLIHGASFAKVKNNIFSIGGSKSSILVDGTSTGGEIDYNCYQNRVGTATGPGSHSVAGDPKFEDPASGDFRVLSSSPCVDAGTSEFRVPPTDIEGNSRCDFPAKKNTGGGLLPYFDIGAYELACASRIPASPMNVKILDYSYSP